MPLQTSPIMSPLDAGGSLPAVWKLVRIQSSHGSSTHGGKHPACSCQVVVGLFSFCLTSSYHSFATAFGPAHQHTARPCLSPAPQMTTLGQSCWMKIGTDRQTDRHPPTSSAGHTNSCAQPHSCSTPLCLLVAMREGRKRALGHGQDGAQGPWWAAAALPAHCWEKNSALRLFWPQSKLLSLPAAEP